MKNVCPLMAALFAVSVMVCDASDGPKTNNVFGHKFVTESYAKDPPRSLYVDGVRLHENIYVDMHSFAETDKGVIAIGSSSAGGNTCLPDPFIVFLAPKKKPEFIGPVELCRPSHWSLNGNTVRFWTDPLPGKDGDNWAWTVGGKLKQLKSTKHQPNPKLGWRELSRSKEHIYSMDLFDYGPVAEALYKAIGKDRTDVTRYLLSLQISSELKGGVFIGETCMAHACNVAGALIVADANTRKVFVAWRGPEGGFQLRPEASAWPGKMQPKLQKWMKSLQD